METTEISTDDNIQCGEYILLPWNEHMFSFESIIQDIEQTQIEHSNRKGPPKLLAEEVVLPSIASTKPSDSLTQAGGDLTSPRMDNPEESILKYVKALRKRSDKEYIQTDSLDKLLDNSVFNW